MKYQRIQMQYSADKIREALDLVIDEQAFTPLRRKVMKKKLWKLLKSGRLDLTSLDPDWLYRLCCASLMLHDYHWFGWEWRSEWAAQLATEAWAYPRWTGVEGELARKHGIERTGKKRVLVVAEQGIGDEIVFASCYHELAADVEEAWIEVDDRLIPIFERSFPENLHFVSRFVHAGKYIIPRSTDYPKFHEGLPIEAFIMAGNVPKLYRHSPADFPEGKTGIFLVADYRKAEKWEDWIFKTGFFPPIGCSWKGRQGEIEPLEYGVTLQYGEKDHNKLAVPPVDLKRDIDEVFALIAALDKVVTTTNAVAHMAGALGVPTDVIKAPPIYATKEDSFNNRVQAWWPVDYSDWYPSVTMYRSQADWRARQ